ncbi:MAG: hypothetical protein H0T50_10365 [Gemmatimonadales bacterium]|nr:hypothetical protein [Gemmatimonadales bacterium]
MPYFAGPVPAILLAGVLLVALLLWLVRGRRHPGPRLHGAEGIDREELEEAEREVRELEGGHPPDGERLGDDWGPGTGRPRPPTRL